MALHLLGLEVPIPSQGRPRRLEGAVGAEGPGSGKDPSPSFQLYTKNHLLPVPPPPPGLPAVVLVTGAAPSPHLPPRLPVLPQAHYRLQTAENELESGRASLLCQNSTFLARARQARQWGHRYPNNEASGMKEGN